MRDKAAKLQGAAKLAAEAAATRAEAEAAAAAALEAEAAAAEEALRLAREREEAELQAAAERLLMELVEQMAAEATGPLAWTLTPEGRSWSACWKAMVLKDLSGYPLWTSKLHDIMRPHFPVLQKIFVHYCGSSAQGAESIGSATKVGLLEVLHFANDTGLATAEFKNADVERQFYIANSQEAIKTTGSADRHRLPNRPQSARGASPSRQHKQQRSASPRRGGPAAVVGGAAYGKQKAAVDQQLTVFEFLNFLVRVSFNRANPKHGAKDREEREVTPVPEAMQILLEECILPKAKRDTSHLFRIDLQDDTATLAVLAEYRDRLYKWMRLICHKFYGFAREPIVLPYDECACADIGVTACRCCCRRCCCLLAARPTAARPSAAAPSSLLLLHPSSPLIGDPRRLTSDGRGQLDGWARRQRDPLVRLRRRKKEGALPQDGGRVVPRAGVADLRRRAHVRAESADLQGQALDPAVPVELSALAGGGAGAGFGHGRGSVWCGDSGVR